MKTARILSLLLVLSPYSIADDDNNITVFEPPKPIKRSPPIYPPAESVNGGEGWVVVNYMVDTEGKVFDPEIIASSGSESFERSAVKVLTKWQFEPAKAGETPIEGSLMTKLTFNLDEEATGARPTFVKKYKDALEAMGQEDWSTVETLLSDLEATKRKNNYEAAFIDYLRAALAGYKQDSANEILHLTNALQGEFLHDRQSSHLPSELTTTTRRRLFALLVEQKRYYEALRIYGTIKVLDEEFANAVAPTADQIRSLADSDTVYNLQTSTNAHGRWSIPLLKSGFSVETEENQPSLQEVKLHCQKKHISFQYTSREEYKIPETWGNCSVIVLGQAHSPFTFWQF